MPAAAIRQGLGDNHSYEWLDGSIKTEMAPGEIPIWHTSFCTPLQVAGLRATEPGLAYLSSLAGLQYRS